MILPTALRLVLAETLLEHGLEEAEADAAVERAPGGEGDEQALGPVGIADRGARLGVDAADALLERGDAAGDFGIDRDALRLFAGGGGGERRRLRLRGGDLRRRRGSATGAAPARARCRARGRRLPNGREYSPSRRGRAGRRRPAGSARAARRAAAAARHKYRPDRNRRSSASRHALRLAQLGGKLQQGLVARRGGDRDLLPSLARRRAPPRR